MKKQIMAIIQARMNSKRLPGKVIKSIQGKPLLFRLKEQLTWSELIDDIVIATSNNSSDEPVDKFCKENNIFCYRGDLDNVLKRFIDCANEFNIDTIIRVNADNPLIDPESIDNMIELFNKFPKTDYINNVHKKGLVMGAGCELVTTEALKKSFAMIERSPYIERQYYFEHVTVFIRKHTDFFNTIKYEPPVELSRNDIFFSVDYPEDLEVVKIIFKNLYREGKYIKPEEIISFLDQNPKIAKINSHLHDSLPDW